MQPERPRARRYPFVASIELTELQSENQFREQTGDLSLFGCHVATGKCLPIGTKVWLRITYQNESFRASGRVASIRSQIGIGIVFTKIEGKDQLVLEKWIAELRTDSVAPSRV